MLYNNAARFDLRQGYWESRRVGETHARDTGGEDIQICRSIPAASFSQHPEAEVPRANLRNATFPCQSWCKIHTKPHTAPQNAEFPENVNGLNRTSSICISMRYKGLKIR
jgi:hypothetical protein